MLFALLLAKLNLSFCSNLESLNEKEIAFLKTPVSEDILISEIPVMDNERYVHLNYARIQPDFIKDVLTPSSGDKKEILDICSGQGLCFKSLLIEQNKSSAAQGFHYTAVETQESNIRELKTNYTQNSKTKGNWLGCAQKGVVDYLTHNKEAKKDKFDTVFAGFALHVLTAQDFVQTIDELHNVMKEGSKLYITLNSYSGDAYTSDYIEQFKKGDILPFWANSSSYFSSDPFSMKTVLETFGFEVKKSGLYRQIQDRKSLTKYLGIIAQKVERSNLNGAESKRKAYYKRAQNLMKH